MRPYLAVSPVDFESNNPACRLLLVLPMRFMVAGVALWVAAVLAASAQLRMTPAQMRAHPAIAYEGPTNESCGASQRAPSTW